MMAAAHGLLAVLVLAPPVDVGGRAGPPEMPADSPAEASAEVAPIQLQPPEAPPMPEPERELEPEPEPEPEAAPAHPLALGPDGQRPLAADGVPLWVPPPLEDDYDPVLDGPETRRARKWRRAGIAATATGAALGATAITFAALDACAPRVGNNCFEDAQRRAVWTIGVPGIVLSVAGVSMMTVGTVRLRRLRAEVSPTASLVPGQRATFGLRGRF